MFSTIVAVVVFLGSIVIQQLLWAVFLGFGLRWAKVTDVTMHRIVFATIAVIGVNIALVVLLRLVIPISQTQVVLIGVAELAVAVLVPCAVIMRVFKARFVQSLQAWLPTLIPTLGMLLAVTLVLRPFFYEAYACSSNSMAPTLLGNHWQATCPVCGQLNFCSPVENGRAFDDTTPMVCGRFHVSEIAEPPQQVFPGDRMLVSKFMKPQRWDVIVFRYPQNPSQTYVMRLVGLPSETIQIESGAVIVNGVRVEPPEFLRGIEYLSQLPDFQGETWATRDRPADLGADEYFVLGDFSIRSNDSRLWREGADGHHAFAVPQSHIIGVATHIYWPRDRWRVLQ